MEQCGLIIPSLDRITNVPTPRQIAVVEDLRGPMIQQGGYAACLELAGEGHGDKTRAKATHAAAKVRVLPECVLA